MEKTEMNKWAGENHAERERVTIVGLDQHGGKEPFQEVYEGSLSVQRGDFQIVHMR